MKIMFQFQNNLAVVRGNSGAYAVVDRFGMAHCPFQFRFAKGVSGGLVAARLENGMCGWFFPDGRAAANGVEVEYAFDSRGLVLPFKQGRYRGWLDLDGNEIIPSKYSKLMQPTVEADISLAWHQESGQYLLFGSDGALHRQLDSYDLVMGDFATGAVWARQKGIGWLMIDENGNPKHPTAKPVPYEFNILDCNESGAVCANFHNGGSVFLNEYGESMFDRQFGRARAFSDGLAAVVLDRLYGYVNTIGEIVIDPIYDLALDFREGFAVVKQSSQQSNNGNRLYTAVDTSGKQLIDQTFYEVYPFSEGIAVVTETKDGPHSLLTSAGEIIQVSV